MDNVLVSIIVPVYNVQKYIKKCVNSLLSQDYKNIEIILVDDGSPDQCGTIIDTLKAKDSRISVIHQQNQGVSAARNAGLDTANGQYVMFVDGDDWVDSNYVSYFLRLVKGGTFDIAFNLNAHSAVMKSAESKEHFESTEECIAGIYSGRIDVAVWNKIYKRELICSHKIKFDTEIWYGEGMLFNIEILQWTEKVNMGYQSVYHQTFNPDSAMRKFNLESNLCGLRSLEIQRKKWKKRTTKIEKQWKYHKYKFYQSILNGIVRANAEKEYPDELKKAISGLRHDIIIPLTSESNFLSILNWLCYFVMPMTMAKRAARKHNKNARNYGKAI